jgi:hypothetical protein
VYESSEASKRRFADSESRKLATKKFFERFLFFEERRVDGQNFSLKHAGVIRELILVFDV